jgi:hypothetical protein
VISKFNGLMIEFDDGLRRASPMVIMARACGLTRLSPVRPTMAITTMKTNAARC